MEPEQRQRRLLIVLVLVAAAAGVYQFWPGGAPTNASSPTIRPSGAGAASVPPAGSAPDVHLHHLEQERPKPTETEARNLFRFQTRSAPPAHPPPTAAPPPMPRAPSGPPPLPPIPLKFIGVVEATVQGQKWAVLSDGRGSYYGREGEIIEGRYRIVRIGTESIEMAYLDGRGRQLIRLSGS